MSGAGKTRPEAAETSAGRNRTEPGTLYIVATPIGNLADVSERAVKVLAECTFVACEDTRNSGLLLARLGIKKPLVSYHEHNRAQRGPEIAARLRAGETCALVTDAGTPAISDPGEDLVAICAAEGIPVRPVPGCCAAVSALSVSALPSRRWVFEGFLPLKGAERRGRIAALAAEERTVILYEAPHRLAATLSELADALGSERPATLCRELTKLNEEILRGTLGSLAAAYAEEQPRGEFVLVVGGASPAGNGLCSLTPEEHVARYVEAGMTEKEAIKAAARDRGVPKNEIYSAVKG